MGFSKNEAGAQKSMLECQSQRNCKYKHGNCAGKHNKFNDAAYASERFWAAGRCDFYNNI